MAMLERGLEVGEDVDRSIMSKEVTNLFFNSCCLGASPTRGVGVAKSLSKFSQKCKDSYGIDTYLGAVKIHVRFIILSPLQVRNTEDSSYRNLRDWYIYRDYMNGLEYVIHAFDHLKKHHK